MSPLGFKVQLTHLTQCVNGDDYIVTGTELIAFVPIVSSNAPTMVVGKGETP